MRVLILSDIHANLTALEAVLDDAADRYDAVWCLGDTVGYGPWPDECVARVRDLGATTVVGNHDWAALGRMDVEDFNTEARRAVLWTAENLSEESKQWLDSLPRQPIEVEGYTLTHGSPRDPIWEYVLYPAVAWANFEHFQTPYCLVGHTHVPTLHMLAQDEQKSTMVAPKYATEMPLPDTSRGILNPGSVGQPRDNDKRAAYALLDTEKQVWEPRRVAYTIEQTQRKMRQAGLPDRLISRLEYGW